MDSVRLILKNVNLSNDRTVDIEEKIKLERTTQLERNFYDYIYIFICRMIHFVLSFCFFSILSFFAYKIR